MRYLVAVPKFIFTFLSYIPLTILVLDLIFVSLFLILQISLYESLKFAILLPLGLMNTSEQVITNIDLLKSLLFWSIFLMIIVELMKHFKIIIITKGRGMLLFMIISMSLHVIALPYAFINAGLQGIQSVFILGIVGAITFIIYAVVVLITDYCCKLERLTNTSDLEKYIINEITPPNNVN